VEVWNCLTSSFYCKWRSWTWFWWSGNL